LKLAALTGLSKEAIADLLKRKVRTFDIRSAHNLVAFSDIRPGERIFITDAVPPDVLPGLCGYIAIVKGIDVHMNRVSMAIPGMYEERETMTGRIQLIIHSNGKVRDIYASSPFQAIYVDAIEVRICDAS
jgi:hypothetical protein